MRIGLNSSDLQAVSNNATPSSAGKTQPAGEAGDSFPEDTVTIGGLAMRALQTPEVRDEVASLQQSVANGQYELDPHAIAEAMLHS